MPDNDIIVVGAGAAGLMAAVVAAERGARVLLLEKMDQPGRKLRITGKGRCNLTNTAPIKDTLPHIGSDSRFLRNCYSRFFNRELMSFFEQRGVALVEERGGRVFPASGRALDIFLALVGELERNSHVTIRKNSMVRSLLMAEPLHAGDKPHIRGVRLQNGESLSARNVIVATGGLSYPTTGSTGAGFLWAQECGHTVVPPVPSLVPLVCSDTLPPDLEGFVLRNVRLTLTQANGHKLCELFGEMNFNADGIGGPIVLSASRLVSRRLNSGEQLVAHINLKPAIDDDELDQRLRRDLDGNGRRLFHDALRLWLPAELVPLALKRLHIEYYKRLHQINAAERHRLLRFLKDCTLNITATQSFNEAIVTQGGVSLKEVNPQTMESRLVDGLYWTGEVLDLDADTGGYNLQIAFSTAYAAATHCT
ncbi:MAG: NAD(FAD)-utilizing dehydrogenase [bacterium P3]|nr:MAG: NAD(FAD)-utilizing dehydrogenase [bacterium P3]